MDDLFNRLKAEPAKLLLTANETTKPKAMEITHLDILKTTNNKEERFNSELVTHSSPRRESMPPPTTTHVVTMKNSNKSRSMSPTPNFSAVKPFKVLIERKNFDEYLSEQKLKNKNSIDAVNRTEKDSSAHSPLVKVTPTKAQQKLFDPIVLEQMQQNNEQKFKLKRCLVRLQRDNLQKLQEEYEEINKKKNNSKKNTKKEQNKSSTSSKAGEKRKASSPLKSPPASKKSCNSPRATKNNISVGGFFIKLATKSNKKDNPKDKLSLAKAKYPKANSSASKSLTKPTKFTRTQLIKTFGKRCFRSHVKIERCKHPLMLIFESNARARKLQSKRNNKSKNLSVSFKDQVEIFGDSDSETDASFDESNMTASTSQASHNKLINSTSQFATPTRLKKVENGKVIDDIEFDTSLFIDPSSSTPYASPGRKKRDKKSFSPLKDDLTASPRKEQLRLADEKLPPSGLRRMHVDVDDEDDEDDDCEYIVPIEIPQRRTSTASSNPVEFNTNVDSANTSNAAEVVDEITETNNDATPATINTTETKESEAVAAIETKESEPVDAIESHQNDSSETFASAEEQLDTEANALTKQEGVVEDNQENNELENAENKTNSEKESIENILNIENEVVIETQQTEQNTIIKDLVNDLLANDDGSSNNETTKQQGDISTNKSKNLENSVLESSGNTAYTDNISLHLYVEEDIYENSQNLQSADLEDKTSID